MLFARRHSHHSEEFDRLKTAAREKIKEKPKSIADKAGILFARAYDHEGDFDREQTILRAIDSLTYDHALKLLKGMFHIETRRQRTFLLFAKEHSSKEPLSSSFDDLAKWKANRQFE